MRRLSCGCAATSFWFRQREMDFRGLRGSLRQFLRAFGNTGNLLNFLRSKPIGRREGNAPGVSWVFQLERDLEKLPDRSRPLDPCHSPAHRSRRLAGFGVRDFERDPHVFEDVVLGLVAASVAVDDESRGALGERTSQRVNTRYSERDCLHNPRAAALPQFLVLVRDRFRHHFRRFVGKIAALFIHGHRRRSSSLSEISDCLRLLGRRSYHPRPACGAFQSGTPMLPLRPRLVPLTNKSVLEKTPDGFLRSGVPEGEKSSRQQKNSRPKSTS